MELLRATTPDTDARKTIAEYSWIQKSLLFAELSRLAYCEPDVVTKIAYESGLDQCDFIARDGAEAYVFGNRFDCLIVCREPNPINGTTLRRMQTLGQSSLKSDVCIADFTPRSTNSGQCSSKRSKRINVRCGLPDTHSEALWQTCALSGANSRLYPPIRMLFSRTEHHALAITNTHPFSKRLIIDGQQ